VEKANAIAENRNEILRMQTRMKNWKKFGIRFGNFFETVLHVISLMGI
jgi:hypothetical protein